MSDKERDFHYPLTKEIEPSDMQKQLVDVALGYIGTRRLLVKQYERDPRIGMDPKKGLDCSGFVSLVLDTIRYPRKNGTADIRFCRDYFDHFGYEISPINVSAGDLIIFSLYEEDRPNHMGIMVSYQEYIHTDIEQGKVAIAQLEFKKIRVRHEPAQYSINPIGFRRLFPLSEAEK